MNGIARSAPAWLKGLTFACASLVISASASPDAARFEGHYVRKKSSGYLDALSGRELRRVFPSEDTIDVVRRDAEHADFLIDFVFFNGDICQIAGPAKLMGNRLRFENRAMKTRQGHCTLEFQRLKRGLRVIEGQNRACTQHVCGRRGAIGETLLPTKRSLRRSERRRVAEELAELGV